MPKRNACKVPDAYRQHSAMVSPLLEGSCYQGWKGLPGAHQVIMGRQRKSQVA